MSNKTQIKGSAAHAVAFDAASYFFDNWIAGGQLSPPISRFNVHAILGTATTLNAVWSTTANASGIFATGTFNSGSNLAAGVFYAFTQLAVASVYLNYQAGATTTAKLFYVDETFDW